MSLCRRLSWILVGAALVVGKPRATAQDNEPPKVEPRKAQPLKVEPPKVEPPKIEPPKIEPPKIEPPKIDPAARGGEIWSISMAPNGRTVALARGFAKAGGTVVIQDLVGDAKKIIATDAKPNLSVAFSPDGRFIANGGFDNTLRIYNVAAGKWMHELTGHQAGINSVAWSKDSKTVATGALDTTVRLWDAEEGSPGVILRGHPQWVFGVAFAPVKNEVVSACKDGTVKVWDVAARKERLTLKGPGAAQCVAVSPDGSVIASGHWDWTVRLWDAADGKPMGVLRGHRLGVYGLAFAPDGETLASTSGSYNVPNQQGEIKIWDVKTGVPKYTLHGHPGAIWCCCFSPDGKTLVTGGADGMVRMWDLGTGTERGTLAPPPALLVANLAPGSAQPGAAPADTGPTFWWLIPAGIVGIGGILAVLLVARRRRPRNEPAALTGEKTPEPRLEVQCPSCQKRLKVNASAAGKKVKCPGCATLFVANHDGSSAGVA